MLVVPPIAPTCPVCLEILRDLTASRPPSQYYSFVGRIRIPNPLSFNVVIPHVPLYYIYTYYLHGGLLSSSGHRLVFSTSFEIRRHSGSIPRVRNSAIASHGQFSNTETGIRGRVTDYGLYRYVAVYSLGNGCSLRFLYGGKKVFLESLRTTICDLTDSSVTTSRIYSGNISSVNYSVNQFRILGISKWVFLERGLGACASEVIDFKL